MSGWGIGIGAFTTGLTNGINLGRGLARDQQTNEINKVKLEGAKLELESAKRKASQATDLENLSKTAGADYDAAVKRGEAEPNHAYDWFSQNYAPRVEQMLLSQGDVARAASWHKWSQDTQTQSHVKQMGELIGTFHDAAATGNFDDVGKGISTFYNGLPADVRHGAKFKDLSVDKADDGTVKGITATFTRGDGSESKQTWADVGSFATTLQGWANPATLYEHTMQSDQQAKKFKANIAEYATKKGIDLKEKVAERGMGIDAKTKTPQQRYSEAQKTLAGLSLDGKPPTDEAVRAFLKQQDDYARTAAPGLAAPGAAPAAGVPAPAKIIIDTKTGKPVAAAPAAAPAVAPGAPPAPAAKEPDPASITAPMPAAVPAAGAPVAAQAVPPTPPGIGIASTVGSSATAPMPPEAAPAAVPVEAPAAPDQRAPGIVVAPPPAPARSVVMPQVGPNAAPQYQDTGAVDLDKNVVQPAKAAARKAGDVAAAAGKYMAGVIGDMPEVRAVKEVGKAMHDAVPRVGKSELDKINAARKSSGMAPLSEEDFAKLTGKKNKATARRRVTGIDG